MTFAKTAGGRSVMKVIQVAPGVLKGADGSPVIAMSIYAAKPADGRPLVAGSDVINEGGYAFYVDASYANGVLVTPDGRPVIPLYVTDALGAPSALAGSGFNTPTLHRVSADGVAPLVLSFDWAAPGTDSVAGYRGQLQIDGNSDFSSPEQNLVFLLDSSSVAGLSENVGLVTPSGGWNGQFRILRDNEAGATVVTDQYGNTFNCDATGWSPAISGTITVSVAVLASVNGRSKSRFVAVASPFHQGISTSDVGSPECVLASIAMAVAKAHFEFIIDGLKSASAGAVNSGICAGAADTGGQDFNSTGFNGTRPGSGSNIPGLTVRASQSGTAATIYRNGGNAAFNIPGLVNAAQGDAIIFEVDNSNPAAPSVAISYYRAATTTATLLTTITLTGLYIPASIWAFGAVERGTGAMTTFNTSDAFTFNPGYATFLSAATTGYNPYG